MTKLGKEKRMNVYFRQTPKEFKSMKQTEVYSHIKRNLPYTLFQFSNKSFREHLVKVSNFISFHKNKLAKKIK